MAPRGNKPTMSSSDDDLKRKKTFFKQRFPGFKKKATELSVLCGNSVGFICHGPDNDLHVWPEPQDNPQTLTEIVSKFNGLRDIKRKTHACDLYDFPNLKGLFDGDLKTHLETLNNHLVGIKQHKIGIIKRGNSKKRKETEEDDHPRVSDSATISNCKFSSSNDRLGFGGVFDELGYVVRGSHETVSNLGSCDTSKASTLNEAVSSRLDPFTLGFPVGYYFPTDPLAVTDNLGVDANNGDWDFSFASTLYADWTVSDQDLLPRVTDSLRG